MPCIVSDKLLGDTYPQWKKQNRMDEKVIQRTKWAGIQMMLLAILLTGTYFRTHQLTELPSGLFVDEAINGIDAQTVGENGRFPLFFSDNNGREPLYIYLQAAITTLLDTSAWSMRLTSAYIGILTLPIMYVLAHEFAPTRKRSAITTGLLAMALLAVSFWHISLSRLGFRVILLLPLSMLTVFFFWRGWKHGNKQSYLLAGAALGASQYTYLAARLLPLLFAAFVSIQAAYFFWTHRPDWRTWRRQAKLHGVLIMAAATIIVAAPLAVYLGSHPEAIGARTGDVFILSTAVSPPAPTLAQNIVTTARLFVDQGDGNLRHNLPNKPALTILELTGFLTGLVLALRAFRRPRTQLLLLWLLIMIIPTVFSTDAPHFLRAAGILPPMLMLTADGLLWLWEISAERWAKRPFLSPIILPFLLLLIVGAITYRDYFQRWGTEPQLYDAFQASEMETAQFALQKLETDDLYLVPDLIYRAHPTLELFLTDTAVRPFDDGCLLYQPQPQRPLTYLIRKPSVNAILPALQEIYPDGVTETAVSHPISGEQFFQTFTIPLQNRSMTGEVMAQFGQTMQLRKTAVSQTDTKLNITLDWLTITPPASDYTLFFHLYPAGEENTSPLTQLDVQPCLPTSQWQSGEILRQTYTMPLPSTMPADGYTIALGWYAQPSFERLPLTSSKSPLDNNRHQLIQTKGGE